jgi:hypothetical protein
VDLAPECPRIVQDVTAISEFQDVELIGLYPNPARDKINVHFAAVNDINHYITVCDLNGRVLIHQVADVNPMNSTISILDLSELNQGTYILKVGNMGSISTTKFVKY